MDTTIDTIDTPLAIIIYIVISAVIAILLLVAAPTILLDYGLAIAWGWMSVLTAWIGIESLHADFEDETAIRDYDHQRYALYRIAWQSATGYQGGGEIGFTLQSALEQCENLNRHWGGIVFHYPEEIPG